MAETGKSSLRDELLASASEAGIALHPVGLAVKRLLDIMGAVIGLLVVGPVLLVLALLIRLESAGPAIFRQQRVGQGGRPFTLYKLRTMVQDAERQGAGLAIAKGDPRITRLGRLLRMTSFDELPQFLNVLKGDMSFVGPAPPACRLPGALEPSPEAAAADAAGHQRLVAGRRAQ